MAFYQRCTDSVCVFSNSIDNFGVIAKMYIAVTQASTPGHREFQGESWSRHMLLWCEERWWAALGLALD